MLRMRKIVNNRIRGESHGENDVQIKGGSKEKVFVGVARFPTSKDKRTFSLRGGSKEKDFVGPARFPTSKDSFSFGRKRKGKKKGKREKDLRARPLQKKTREWREEVRERNTSAPLFDATPGERRQEQLNPSL